jgi:diaminohydroxyphosphoribosylaminopyrimidine deaminase/5-amino-6-(5-phosphoribosylamino)uracil reductase
VARIAVDPVDLACMQRALKLAARGQGAVEPNPMVGCVITRNGRTIAEGYHRRFGGAHAEVEALRRCKSPPRGATVYVTLEPCCRHGKTPPCTNALISAAVARVVAAHRDPHPHAAGRGFRVLRKAGLDVSVGLLEEEARRLNAPYFKRLSQQRPWVVLKWAQSLDGKIATRSGDAKWISDERMRAHAHRVRGRMDAILIGLNTLLNDDPLLTCRAGRPRRTATRVVLDTRLRTPPNAQLVRTANQTPTWIFCGRKASRATQASFEHVGCVVYRVPTTREGLSLHAILDILGEAGMTNVLVEGGGRLLGRFADHQIADEIHVYLAPLLIGGQNAVGALEGLGPRSIEDAKRLHESSVLRRLGSGWFVRARLH